MVGVHSVQFGTFVGMQLLLNFASQSFTAGNVQVTYLANQCSYSGFAL